MKHQHLPHHYLYSTVMFTFLSLIFYKMENILFVRTCFVLILYIVGGNDAISIKPLCPPEIHTTIFYFSHLQLWRVWGL